MSYNIKSMRTNYQKALTELENNIVSEFKNFFSSFYTDNSVPPITNSRGCTTCFYTIKNHESINEIFSGAGLYLIFSNVNFASNECSLTFNSSKVIYRGESSLLKKRIESHLFNKLYNKYYDVRESEAKEKRRNFGEVRYNTCIKVKQNENGININEEPYLNHEWFVIIHKMVGSNSIIRKQAEIAFDSLYNKPFANRETRKNNV